MGMDQQSAGAEGESEYELYSVAYWMPTEAIFLCPYISKSLLTVTLSLIHLSENSGGGWR